MSKARSTKQPASPIKDDTIHEVAAEEMPHENGVKDEVKSEPQPEPTFGVAIMNLIDKQVMILDPYQKRADELVALYDSYTIKDISDKEGYEKVRLAIADLRKVRTGTEDDRKAAKAPLLKAGSLIDEKAEFIRETVSKLEEKLKARKKEIDDEIEAQKVARKKLEEQRLFNRLSELVKMGAVSDNGIVTLGDVSYQLSMIRESDQDIFDEDILPEYQKVYDQKLAAKKAEDDRIAEEQRLLKQQQDALAEEKRLFEEQKLALQKQQDERDALLKKEADEKAAEAQRLSQIRYNERSKVLLDLGMQFDLFEDAYKFESVLVAIDTLKISDDESFAETVNGIKPKIAELQAEIDRKAEVKRQADIQAGIDKALKDAEDKRLADAETKRLADEAEEKRKADELLKAGDKANWNDFIQRLSAITLPVVKSGQYREKSRLAKEKIDYIKSL